MDPPACTAGSTCLHPRRPALQRLRAGQLSLGCRRMGRVRGSLCWDDVGEWRSEGHGVYAGVTWEDGEGHGRMRRDVGEWAGSDMESML